MSLITLPDHTITHLGGHGVIIPTPFAQTIELLRCEIAGIAHHRTVDTTTALARHPALALVREPDNPHDSDAIAVHLDGRKVGYVPRRHNTVLARLLDAGKCLQARVLDLNDPEDEPWVDVRVVVEMEG